MSRRWATASAIERVLECSASAVLPQTMDTSDYSKSGNEIHSCIEELILNPQMQSFLIDDLVISRERLEISTDAIPEVAYSYDVVSGEANRIGRSIGREYPQTAFSTICGTADLVTLSKITFNDSNGEGVSSACVDVVDWKTGYEAPPADSWQMKTLALMAARAEGVKHARTRITHIRGGVWHSQWRVWTEVEFAEIEKTLRRAYDAVNKLGWKKSISISDVRYGPHCHFCPAYLSCPYTKSLLSREPGLPDTTGAVLSNLDAVAAYNRWQSIRTLSGKLEAAIKAYAVARPIELPGNYRYGKSTSGAFKKFRAYVPEDSHDGQ